MTTLEACLADMRRRLAEAGMADAAIEARILLAGLIGLSPGRTAIEGNRPISDAEARLIEEALRRRLAHEPVFRILGHRAFHDLDLALSDETLEPRPDSEVLVATAARLARDRIASGRLKPPLRIADLGTGTGAIGLALLIELPLATAVLTDISADALMTAQKNAEANGLAARVTTVLGPWYDAVQGRFDIIVSNPPYIPRADIAALAPEVRLFDPLAALDGGIDGLDAYRALASGAADHLTPDGLIAVEIGHDQKDSVTALFEEAGLVRLAAERDLGGNDRVLAFAARN